MLAVELEPMFAEDAAKRKQEAGKKYGRGLDGKLSADLHEAIPSHEHRSDTKAGQLFGVGQRTVSKAKKVAKVKLSKVKDIIAGKTTVDAVYKKINQAEREKKAKEKLQANEKAQAKIVLGDSIQLLDRIPDQSYDCLLTDPLYITDVEDFELFTKSWIHKVFSKIKLSGYAFIFCSSDPQEISVYYRELSQIPDFTMFQLYLCRAETMKEEFQIGHYCLISIVPMSNRNTSPQNDEKLTTSEFQLYLCRS